MMKRSYLSLLLPLWLLVACGGDLPAEEAGVPSGAASESAVATPLPSPTSPPAVDPTALPTTPAAVVATAAPPPSPTPEAIATATPSPTMAVTAAAVATLGRTAEGAFFRGRADAPVTIIDYSDFL